MAQSLTLDAGGLLFSTPSLLPGQEEQAHITAKSIIETYGMMHYDAVGLNAYDLAAGVDFLKETSRLAKFPWLSANLLRASDQKPVFQPAITKTIGAIRVGIIGITDPAADSGTQDDFVIVPWQQTLPLLARKMSNSCDLLILLSSLPDQENHRIADEVEGIHLIFSTGEENLPTEKTRNTLITGTGKKGKYLGELLINWQPTKIWGVGKTEQLQATRQKLDQINWRLKRLERKLRPEKGMDSNPSLLKDYQNLTAAQKELSNKISALEDAADAKICTYKNRFIALETNLPENPKIQAVIDRAQDDVNRAGKKRTPAPGATTLYIGPQRCTECHPSEGEGWRNSRHAGSYRTLTTKKQQFNLACLPCHVTGITDANAHLALTLAENQQLVGCEACHGAGIEHANTGGHSPLQAPHPGAEVCQRCHTPEHSDDFNYQRDRNLVH